MKVILWLGVTTTWGAVLKGHSIRKVGNCCTRPYCRTEHLDSSAAAGIHCYPLILLSQRLSSTQLRVFSNLPPSPFLLVSFLLSLPSLFSYQPQCTAHRDCALFLTIQNSWSVTILLLASEHNLCFPPSPVTPFLSGWMISSSFCFFSIPYATVFNPSS